MAAQFHVVIGLGQTGQSCLRYLRRAGHRAIRALDSRSAPPALSRLRAEFPEVEFITGPIPESAFANAGRFLVSPGVNLLDPQFKPLASATVPICCDIQVFAQHCHQPIAAITGSNGKTTVTHMLADMARQDQTKVKMVGNVGNPVLDHLLDLDQELYVLECSSFQLDFPGSLGAAVACFLNLSADHLDRHRDLGSYRQAKQNIYRGAKHAVYNRHDLATKPDDPVLGQMVSFALDEPPTASDWGIKTLADQDWLVRGKKPLLPVSACRAKQRHEILNALAAAAMADLLGCSWSSICTTIRTYKALPHRFQDLEPVAGVRVINDSKATNVGATCAALQSLAATPKQGRLYLLAGGDSKAADLKPLQEPIKQMVDKLLVYGRDAHKIASICQDCCEILVVATLQQAVDKVWTEVKPGDTVLLSPACASQDMFTDYRERGDVFARAVAAQRELCE